MARYPDEMTEIFGEAWPTASRGGTLGEPVA
jgi:hypothetical protein